MSERSFSIPRGEFPGFRGYTADVENASIDLLAPPSVNCLINEQGVAETRMGFEDTGWNLNQANKAATSHYMKKYDVTFFALGTKVLYVDHNNSNAVVDTGITLTNGTTTRFAEFCGDLYLTNTTDGLRRIVVTRLNGSASIGGDITIDRDGAARLSVFGRTTGDIRVNGTNEAYSSVTVSSGVLDTTSSAAYTDNTIAIHVHDISGVSGIEKASKVFFWKRRLGMLGSEVAGNSDQPNNTLYYGKFAGPANLEDIISFAAGAYDAGGSTRELVGEEGRVTNAVPVQDYLYQFTEEGAYVTAASDVIISGTGIGTTTPDLKDENNGCVNEDCAVSLGNGEIAYVTPSKRIMRIRIAADSGAPIVFPDDSFDMPMRKLLALMDPDQTNALVYRHKAKKRVYFQLKISSEWVTLCYDSAIKAWQPPQKGKAFKSVFERNGILYGTDLTDDTIYKLDSTYNDNGSPIECCIATGIFNTDDAMIKYVDMKGKITQPTTVHVKIPVNDADLSTVHDHTIVGTTYTYGSGHTNGSVALGSTALAGDSSDTGDFARWKKVFDVFPSEANRAQVVTSSLGDGHSYSVSFVRLRGTMFSDSFTRIS